MNSSRGRYFARKTNTGSWDDLTELFDGVAILELNGLLDRGAPVNIHTAQWTDSQVEDFVIATLDDDDDPVVIRANVDLTLTFIVRRKYATGNINVQSVHEEFVDYMTNSDLWIRSSYMGNKYAHCVCLKEYKPTTIKLGRGNDSFIIGTITLHCLDAPH